VLKKDGVAELVKLGVKILPDPRGGIAIVSLTGTDITDAGLVHLKGLTNLKWLFLYNTKVTDVGVAELYKTFPKLTIFHRL